MMLRKPRKTSVIDRDGFRANVGIVLANKQGMVFFGKRVGPHDAWQFPQGGLLPRESLEQALFRELHEEVGLGRDDVEIVKQIKHWIYYRLPKQYIRHHSFPLCIGQKQKWFLLRLTKDDSCIRLDTDPSPEFDGWRWVDCWEPMKTVVEFKRHVYREVLREFEPILKQWPEVGS
jgi:putative (di)nucleoside polyphosphate hydrolase